MSNRKIYVIAGNPVLHSKSPLLFNTYFETGNHHAYYTRLAALSVAEILETVEELDIQGMNITSPFKHDIFSVITEKDDASSAIRGINTVIRDKNRLTGFNTDHTGVTGTFKANDIKMKHRKSVVLGAGGAGRAAAFGLIEEKSDVTVFNRTVSKAREAADDLGCRWDHMANLEKHIRSCDILVSTLSASLSLIQPAWLSDQTVVLDANYRGSPLCNIGKARGCRVFQGEYWLVHQAIPGLFHFTGETTDFNTMGAGLKKRYPNRGKKNIILIGSNPGRTKKIARYLSARYGFPSIQLNEKQDFGPSETIYFGAPEILSKMVSGVNPARDAWVIGLVYKNDIRLKAWLSENAGRCNVLFPSHKNTVEVGSHICSELNSVLDRKGAHG